MNNMLNLVNYFIVSFRLDTKNSVGLAGCIEEVSHNAIAVYWNPLESSAKVIIYGQNIKIHFFFPLSFSCFAGAFASDKETKRNKTTKMKKRNRKKNTIYLSDNNKVMTILLLILNGFREQRIINLQLLSDCTLVKSIHRDCNRLLHECESEF